MNKIPQTSTALAVLRVALGFLFAAHGWQKFNEYTIAGTQAAFAQMGVPAANIAAPVIATIEITGGIALILGLVTRLAAAALAATMLGAFLLVHATAGIFVEKGGFELVLILGAAALTLTIAGAGRFSVDYVLFGREGSRFSALA